MSAGIIPAGVLFPNLCYTIIINAQQINIVVVGASHAGVSCAINLKKHAKAILSSDNNIDINVILLESSDGNGLSFVGADGLLWVAGVIPEQNMCYTTADKVRSHGIDLRLNHRVVSIDDANKVVNVDSLDSGTSMQIEYDYLVLATGSRPVIPDVVLDAVNAGYIELDVNGETIRKPVQVMKDYRDAYAMATIRDNSDVRRVGVIGGGYIGVEVAETLRKVGKDVVIFQGADRLVNTYYDAGFSELLEKQVINHGIELKFGKRFEGFDDVDFNDIDAFVLAIGFKANTELARISGLELKSNAIFTDKFQETSSKDIYAIGDCSVSYNNALQDYQYLAIGSATAREANISSDAIIRKIINNGENAFGELGKEYLSRITQQNNGTVGSNALTIYNFNLAGCGLTLESAEKFGISAASVDFVGELLDPILQNEYIKWIQNSGDELAELKNGKLKIRIVYELSTRRIIGFQAASHADPTGFTHFFSLAISKSMTLDDVKNTDLFFSPLLNQLYNHLTRVLSQI